MFERKGKHEPDDAADHGPRKEFSVRCQDGTGAVLVLEKSGPGKYPTADAVQRWFTAHGDAREGKCKARGCAVCLVSPAAKAPAGRPPGRPHGD